MTQLNHFHSSSKNMFVANQELFNKVMYVVYDGALRQCKLLSIETKFDKVVDDNKCAISIHQQAILHIADRGDIVF